MAQIGANIKDFSLGAFSRMTQSSHQQRIKQAQDALNTLAQQVDRSVYPGFHLAPPAGWMNDPNGVIYHQGYYHVFYQHHPFSPQEAQLIYWGHARSKDLCRWEHLPIALAPSIEEDRDGCFSGCAVVNDQDRFCLIYTAHRWAGEWGDDRYVNEVQVIAVSQDGIHFDEKQVIIRDPPVAGVTHFRDPRVWREGKLWRMIIGFRTDDDNGQGIGHVALYNSDDLYHWTFDSIFASDDGQLPPGQRAFMWECPDFFPLDGRHVLMMSPQGLHDPEEKKYLNLFQNGYLLGHYRAGRFTPETVFEELDYGHEFYAAQSIEGPNGRRVLIAWFDMWANDKPSQLHGWAGMMTLPRDLRIQGDRLCMTPAPELVGLRLNHSAQVLPCPRVDDGQTFPLPIGDHPLMEIELDIDLAATTARTFGIDFHVDDASGAKTRICIDRDQHCLILDRTFTGSSPSQSSFTRRSPLPEGALLRLHIFLDRPSIELFVGNERNVGLYSLSSRVFPSPDRKKQTQLFAQAGTMVVKKIHHWPLKDTFHFEPLTP